MATTHASIVDCITAVSETFATVFASIDAWRSAIGARVEQTYGSLTSVELDELVEGLVVDELAADDALVIGAGFVASPGFLADTKWHLAWWLGRSNTFGVGSGEPSVRRLAATEDESSENFRDYTTLEWWRVPAATRAAHITGPYVDYLCTDDYTLTLTVPVDYAGELIGVAGADLYVDDVERALLPHVRALGRSATIVNASGRVVVSTDPHQPTGALVRVRDLRALLASAAGSGSVALDDGRELLACGATSLGLILGETPS